MPSNWRLGCTLVLLGLIATSVQAAQINETQLEVLLDIAEDWPVLKGLSTGAWVLPGLNGSCDANLAYGITECDADGWITKVRFENIALGAMSPEFGRMDGLLEAVFYNSLSGSMIDEWSTLEKLQVLNIDGFSGTSVTGPYPSSWSSLTNLRQLILQRMNLNATIPDAMLASPQLRYLRLTNSGVHGPLPDSLGQHELEHLTIENDPAVGGSFPATLASNAFIRDLFFKGLGLTGSLPSDFSGATALVSFGLNNNALSGSLPSVWPTAGNLRNLWWPDNDFNGEIPQSFMDIPSISQIDLSLCSITGAPKLPTSTSATIALLDLTANALSGQLPSDLFAYPSLSTLRLGGNAQLGGSIPTNIQTSCSLREFKIDHNDHTGSLPSGLGNCSMLTSFYASFNRLTGTVPDELLALLDTNLNILHLDNNGLTLCAPSAQTIPETANCNVAQQSPAACGCNDMWSVCLTEPMPTCPVPTSTPTGSATALSLSTLIILASLLAICTIF